MKEYTDSGYKIQEFDSFSEVADYLESVTDLKDYKLTKKSYLKDNSSFLGISSFDNVLERLRYGDKVQTELFINELKDLDTFDETDVGIFRDVEGFAYDMGSVVNGEPECCLNFGSPEAKLHLNVYIDLAYTGWASPTSINNRGLAIIKLVNSLISKGYILDIYVVRYATLYNDEKYAQQIKVPTQFLTLSTLAYACTCDFYRIVTWLLTAIQCNNKNYAGDSSAQIDEELLEAIKARGDLYISGGFNDRRFDSCDKKEAEELVMGYYNDYVQRKEGKEVVN